MDTLLSHHDGDLMQKLEMFENKGMFLTHLSLGI